MKQPYENVRITRNAQLILRDGVYHIWWHEVQEDGSKKRVLRPLLAGLSEEEAEQECDRIFASMLLNGAQFKNPRHYIVSPGPYRKENRVDLRSDECIYPAVRKMRIWKVFFKGKFIGAAVSKERARKIRDHYLVRYYQNERLPLPCAICGKRPELRKTSDTGVYEILHDEAGCSNRIMIRMKGYGKQGAVKMWNDRLMTGNFWKKGRSTVKDLRRED